MIVTCLYHIKRSQQPGIDHSWPVCKLHTLCVCKLISNTKVKTNRRTEFDLGGHVNERIFKRRRFQNKDHQLLPLHTQNRITFFISSTSFSLSHLFCLCWILKNVKKRQESSWSWCLPLDAKLISDQLNFDSIFCLMHFESWFIHRTRNLLSIFPSFSFPSCSSWLFHDILIVWATITSSSSSNNHPPTAFSFFACSVC